MECVVACKKFSVFLSMPNAHIAYRVDYETLIKNPELVLQKMSFKILEKREAIFENMKNNKVQFKTSHGIEQGTCQSINANQCHVKVGNAIIKVPIQKLILSDSS